MQVDLSAVMTVRQELEFHLGVHSVVAGGAVRDMLHNRCPKDFDLLILGWADPSEVLEVLYDIDPKVQMFRGDDDINIADVDPASLAGSDSLGWVAKITVDGWDIDIIQYVQRPETPKEMVEHFDCTLNMCWLNGDGNPVKHERYPEPNGKVAMLPLCDYPVPRRNYLREKYPNYQWPTDTELETHPNYQGARC